MIREVVQVGHPALKAHTRLVENFTDPKLTQVVEDLIDTMHAVELIGIAATQIGEDLRVCVTEPRKTDTRPEDQSDILRVYINPTIIRPSATKSIIWEGCGSYEHAEQFGPVSRPDKVTVMAYDLSGHRFFYTANGILGRVIQHEIDHLDGREFVDLIDKSLLIPKEKYIAEEKMRPEHLRAQHISIKRYQG